MTCSSRYSLAVIWVACASPAAACWSDDEVGAEVVADAAVGRPELEPESGSPGGEADAGNTDATPMSPPADGGVAVVPVIACEDATPQSFHAEVYGSLASCTIDADCHMVAHTMCAKDLALGCANAVEVGVGFAEISAAASDNDQCSTQSCTCAPFAGDVRCLDDLCTAVPDLSCGQYEGDSGRYGVLVAPSQGLFNRCDSDGDCHMLNGGGPSGLGECYEVTSADVSQEQLDHIVREFVYKSCSAIGLYCGDAVPPTPVCSNEGFCEAE